MVVSRNAPDGPNSPSEDLNRSRLKLYTWSIVPPEPGPVQTILDRSKDMSLIRLDPPLKPL